MADIKLVSAGDDIKFWDSDYTLFKQINPHGHNISSLAWTPDNTLLASTSSVNDKIALTYIHNISRSLPEIPIENKAGGLCVDFNSNSRYLLIGRTDNAISIYDCKTKTYKKTYTDHKGPVTAAQFNFNDSYVASGSETGEIILHHLVTRQACSPLVAPNVQAIRQLQYSFYKKSLLASASDDGCVNLWDTNTRRLLHSFSQSHRAPASGVAFSPINEGLLCSVGMDKRIQIYDAKINRVLNTYMAESPLTSIDMFSDGSTFAVGSTRGKIYIFDMRQGKKPQKILSAHRSSVKVLKFRNSPDLKFNSKGSLSVKPNEKPTKVSPTLQRRHLPTEPTEDPAKSKTPESQSTFSRIKATGDGSDSVEDIFSPIREGYEESKECSGIQSRSNNSTGNVSANVSDGLFSPLAENSSLLKVNRRVAGQESSYVTSPLAGNVHTSLSASRGHSFTLPQHTTQTEPVSSGVTPNIVLLEESPVISQPVHNHRTGISHSVSDISAYNRLADSPHGRGVSASPSLPSVDRVDWGGEAAMGTANGLLPPKTINFDNIPVGGASMRSPEGALASSSDHGLFPNPSQLPERGNYSADVDKLSQGGATHQAAPSAQVQPFQQHLIRNLIQEAMEDFRDQVHRDMLSMHMDMIRQFQIQLGEVRTMLQQYSVNEELLTEVERLREENKRLKKTF